MIYSTVHGITKSPKRTKNTIEIDSHSIKFGSMDVRTKLKELYSDMIDYEFRGHTIIVYLP